jgi:hypothetical protein
MKVQLRNWTFSKTFQVNENNSWIKGNGICSYNEQQN